MPLCFSSSPLSPSPSPSLLPLVLSLSPSPSPSPSHLTVASIPTVLLVLVSSGVDGDGGLVGIGGLEQRGGLQDPHHQLFKGLLHSCIIIMRREEKRREEKGEGERRGERST